MKRYFEGGPFTGTWREVDGHQLAVPLHSWDPSLWRIAELSDPVVDRLSLDDVGYYEQTGKPARMKWISPERTHWTNQPLGEQFDRELAHHLAPGGALLVLAVLQQMAKTSPFDLARNCEWWLPHSMLRGATVIYGLHVARKPQNLPILAVHAIPSGWRAGVDERD